MLRAKGIIGQCLHYSAIVEDNVVKIVHQQYYIDSPV